ncbi:Bud site selection protein bud4 [Aspergillus nanangensis]|uniref:Bud site selection protein bud4 n=1 Tax=Aspergillus nanangensis TaxID=2582783 RepID=A0AAD4GRH9_ASPNN|nr:Bud site selection protein bud4 [Aspergillus nanangensis]
MGSNAGQRPLSEVSPMAQRRNSPIWSQPTRMMKNSDSSPYDGQGSPRLFWQGRESASPFPKSQENQAPYDPESPFSPAKRASLENLKRQSRVKNSNMLRDYNQEYDPTHVYVPQRPLATQRSPQQESSPQPPTRQEIGPRPPSPSKDQVPPSKSSLSRASRYGFKDAGFDPESEIWSDFDSRHGKSVTFDAAPPQVNEYEMTTPDPSSLASGSRDGSYDSEDSEADISFDHDTSMDRDDSFDASLEDLEKTPVVLPEDWRYMSPANANDQLVKEDEDPFTEDDEAHSPAPRPSSRQDAQPKHSRVESTESNEERRPLPPLPGVGRSSPAKFSAAFELASGGQRTLPAPPAPAQYSKTDISELGHSPMSLEDRLRLMMIQEGKQETKEEPNAKDVKIEVSEITLPCTADASAADSAKPSIPEKTETVGDGADTFNVPRISRDSILKDLRRSESFEDDSFDYSSQAGDGADDYMHYDPDVPIPSLENDNDIHDDNDDDDDDTSSVVIKPEEHDEDLYDIPSYFGNIPSNDSSFKTLQDQLASDASSKYSSHSLAEQAMGQDDYNVSSDEQSTPVAEEPPRTPRAEQNSPAAVEKTEPRPLSPLRMEAIRESLYRPMTPENQEEMSEPSTPDSVIRHPVDEDDQSDREITPELSVPDPVATVKAPGGCLKTRPSLTPLDLETMAATRRKISGQHPPPMPSLTKQKSNDSVHSTEGDVEPPEPTNKASQRQSSLMKLDIPFSIQEESLGFGLDKEFDRVIETQKVAFELSLSHLYSRTLRRAEPQDPQIPIAKWSANQKSTQQRGYLMRHNTKVVIASNRNEDEPAPAPAPTNAPVEAHAPKPVPTPRKASQQTWTTEPWNGKHRRSSVRATSSAIRKKPLSGPVPPLPGQQSNVQETPTTIEENEPAVNGALEEGEERGRLFVKVVGMKYLDLPLPRGERSYFALTLDNGLHCVTTAWLELGKTAPIGQEFELIVHNDLEFQLTLQMKADEQKLCPQETAPSASPTRQKASTFSRVFASPRKRKELEMKQQLASQQQKGRDVNAPVWERLRSLIARDGSFGRAYVALSDHEKHAFGRPYTVDIACFNEWAVEDQPSSVKSKKSTSSTSQRRPPYKIGKLELQLLFVPKPKGGKDDDMPKSLNACIREMRDAENVSSRSWEGFLSQQGGDCPFWRRRFFKLQGSKLTAFHETTRQPRATINLSKAAKLIDDKSSLTKKETSTKGGGRRKSAFAEEEEGYMFVEEGFRIRFGNGEVIDFYADSPADKDGWMSVLADAVGKGSSGGGQVKPWTELVLKRERSTKTRRDTVDRHSVMGPPPPPPIKKDNPPAPPRPASPQRPRHRYTQSQPEARGADARRQKARSLMF